MAHNLTSEQRSAQRYVISLPVRAEWDDETSGEHVVADGETENVGPASALVHLHQLPRVGSRVQLAVSAAGDDRVLAVAEVLRVERNPAQPLAALQLMNATDEWRGLVWEYAGVQVNLPDDNYEVD